MKTLRQLFQCRSVRKGGQKGLTVELGRDDTGKWTLHIARCDFVRGNDGIGGGSAERLPGRTVGLSADCQTLRLLERGDRTPQVGAKLPVNLPRRETLAVEQNLDGQSIGTAVRGPRFLGRRLRAEHSRQETGRDSGDQ